MYSSQTIVVQTSQFGAYSQMVMNTFFITATKRKSKEEQTISIHRYVYV